MKMCVCQTFEVLVRWRCLCNCALQINVQLLTYLLTEKSSNWPWAKAKEDGNFLIWLKNSLVGKYTNHWSWTRCLALLW